MARKRNWRPEILADIEEMSATGATATKIAAQLQSNFPHLKEEEIPSVRTVQEIVKELSPPDPSGLWRLATASPDEAVVILPVMRWMVSAATSRISRSGGREAFPSAHGITEGLARWIVKVHRACPDDLPPVLLFYLARQYQLREISGLDSTDFDIFMAFTPWRGEEHHRQLTEALEAGSIPVGDQRKFSVLLVVAKRWLTPSEQAEVTTLRPAATPALQHLLSEFERRQEKLDREDWARTRKGDR